MDHNLIVIVQKSEFPNGTRSVLRAEGEKAQSNRQTNSPSSNIFTIKKPLKSRWYVLQDMQAGVMIDKSDEKGHV